MDMKTRKLFVGALSFIMGVTTVTSPQFMLQAATGNGKLIQLNVPSKVTMYTGSSKTVKVAFPKNQGSSQKVTFKSSNKKVAKVSTKGVVRALKSGKASITVTSVANKKIRKSVKVIVKDIVKNTTESISMVQGDSVK